MKKTALLVVLTAAVFFSGTRLSAGTTGSIWGEPEIFLGYGYFNYAGINQQFKTYHRISGISNLPVAGARWRENYGAFLVGNTLAGTFTRTNQMAGSFQKKYSAWSLSDNVKISTPILNRGGNLVAPFVGVALNYLKIRTDFNYAIKCPDCFFQYRRNYTSLSAGLLYGISFEHVFLGSDSFWNHLGFGVDVGGTVPFWDKEWRINGQKIGDKALAPEALFKSFAAFRIIIR